MKVSVTFLVFLFSTHTVFCGYGDESNGYPNYQERAGDHLTNVVRIDPTSYKTIYGAYNPSLGSVLTSTYPAVNPIYYPYDLNRAGRYHANDMATKNYFSHDSQDGTSTWDRISSFYSCGGNGENIAAGNSDPRLTINQWLCDKSGTTCCPDGQSCDGHRRNIMGSGFRTLGSGYAFGSSSTYKHYWVQDFSNAVCTVATTFPIPTASHINLNSKIRFMALWYSTAAPTSASVVINGVSYPLTKDAGTNQRGNFIYESAVGSGCREYYFVFTANGNTYKYPETGSLLTFGETGCTSAWKAGQAGTVAATTGVAQPATTGVRQPATTGTVKPATTGIQQPATTGVAQPVTTGVAQPATTGIAQAGTTGVVTPPGTVELERDSDGTKLSFTVSGGSVTVQVPGNIETADGQIVSRAKYSAADSTVPGFVDPTATAPAPYKGVTFMIDYFDAQGTPIHNINSKTPTIVKVSGDATRWPDLLYYYDTDKSQWVPAIFSCNPGYFWTRNNEIYTYVCHATQYAIFESGPYFDQVDAYNQGEPQSEAQAASDEKSGGGSSAALIGGVVGGVALLVIAGIVIGFFVYKKRNGGMGGRFF